MWVFDILRLKTRVKWRRLGVAFAMHFAVPLNSCIKIYVVSVERKQVLFWGIRLEVQYLLIE